MVNQRAKEDERRWANDQATQINELVQARYRKQHAGKRVILMLGSSQTWGAGASKDEDVIAPKLEQLLGSDRFLVLNAGVSSFKSVRVVEQYDAESAALHPSAVLINLSNNDQDPEVLKSNIRKIAEKNLREGIVTIIIMEPNTPEADRLRNLEPNHAVLRELAAELKLPLVDIQSFLDEHADDGFLWWDSVHLTSFGQKLFAQELRRQIEPMLDSAL
jgi:lysophospholipase L1-like esterase